MDDLEGIIRNKNQPDGNVITPPDDRDYDMKLRRKSIIDLEHPNALDPDETKATESPANSLPYRLHKVADVPFRFPSYLCEGLTHPGVPFPIAPPAISLPIASPGEVDRYSHSTYSVH